MIQSMTGFARHMRHTDWGHIGWEIRSINHRFLDLHFHLPEQWRELESEMRKQLQQKLTRGKVDIYLNYMNHKVHSDIHLNETVISALMETYTKLKDEYASIHDMDMFDILRWPGAIKIDQTPSQDIKALVLQSFQEAVDLLVIQREREGTALVEILQKKIKEITTKLDTVIPRREQVMLEQRNKFLQRIETLQLAFDQNRLEQELLIWAQKSDIVEEIDRLYAHLKEVAHILNGQQGAIGRQLDFLVQELQREANTLTSKSSDVALTTAAVDIKVYIEQIREQLQNIA